MRSSALLFLLTALACNAAAPPAAAEAATQQPTPGDPIPSEPSARQDPDPVAEGPTPIAADASASIGAPAPNFTLEDLDGKQHQLSDYAGKTVVLEWFNPQCPFVGHAHTEGSLVSMAKQEAERGVVWLAINSGAPGKQGHGPEANRSGIKKFEMNHPVLIDASGAVGHAYGAKKTPHVYLIDESGTLVYRGAIDNAPFGEVDGDGKKINYLATALSNLRGKTALETPETPAYGCTVKY